MQINEGTLSAMYRGFKTTFQGAFNDTPSQLDKIATTVPSSTAIEDYGWMGAIPGMREWVGDRVIHNLSLHTYTIKKDRKSTRLNSRHGRRYRMPSSA